MDVDTAAIRQRQARVQAEADADMIARLTERCARRDRKQVEAEELAEHPLLAGTSTMHYLCAPAGPDDFPGFTETAHNWETAMTNGNKSAVVDGRGAFFFDAPRFLASTGHVKRIFIAREEFVRLVVEDTPRDVVGYWFRPAMRMAFETLMLMAVHTAGAVLLSDSKEVANVLIFNYAALRAHNERLVGVLERYKTLSTEHYRLDPVFYMDNPLPEHIDHVRTTYPEARIVAIVCPVVDVEQQCLNLLRQRQAAQKK